MSYSKLYNRKVPTSATQPIPGRAMVPNNNGGYSFELDNWKRLDRLIILGSETNQFAIDAETLTQQNASNAIACIKEDGVRVVNRLVEISKAGRAPKNDHAIFLLSLAAAEGCQATKTAAYAAVPEVCRTSTHLFQFAETSNALRGWGRGLRRAIARWYETKSADDLAYQVTKYQQRNGWSHRDLLRLTHIKPDESSLNSLVYKYVMKKDGQEFGGNIKELSHIFAFEQAKKATTEKEIVALVRQHGMARECIPTQFLNSPQVWDALLEKMPMTAMIRNLGTMSKIGLLKPLSAASKKICAELSDVERLKKSRIHPIALLLALKTYASGRGFRGSSVWTPVRQVVDALDSAFYQSFVNVEPTGLRYFIGLDVSGSMHGVTINNSNLTASEAAAAMSLITLKTEPQTFIGGFSSKFIPLSISPKQRLDDICKYTRSLPFDYTVPSTAIEYAIKNNIEADIFVFITDNDVNGGVHVSQRLQQYRKKTGIPTKMAVLATCSNHCTIADPTDAGQCDFVGFDTATPQLLSEFALGNI